jgi:transmembrane protein EpsG
LILPVAAIVPGVFLCRERFKNAGKAIYCIFAGAGLFAVAALRYAVGHDYILYANWFNSARLLSVNELAFWSREKGFLIPVKILADMSADYQIMFILIALVITAGVMLLIYKNSSAPWVSVAAFLASGLFFNSLNFMRQFIAAVIIAFALRYIAKKRFFRYAGLVLFASAFHFSALIMLPFYFVFKLKLNLPVLGITLVGSAAVYIFVTPLMNFVTNFFYTAYDTVTNVEAASGLSPVYTIAFALFFLAAFLLRKMLMRRNNHANTLLFSMYFAVFFSLLGTVHGIIARLSLLFIIAPVLILSADIYMILRELIRLTFKDSIKKARICVLVVSLFFFCLSGAYYGYLLAVKYNGVVPYQTIFAGPSPPEVQS